MKFLWTTLRVSDLEKSLAFYRDALGLAVQERFGQPGHEIAMLGTPDGTKLELLCEAGQVPAALGQGVSMGFAPEDLDALVAQLKGQGLAVSPPISPNPSIRFCFVADPDGYTVQLAQQR